MPEQNTSQPLYQKLSNYPPMPPARRAELLESFYATQLEIIDALSSYMVPLFRYFAQELEKRNTENDEADDAAEINGKRVSRLKAVQLRQIAKMLMEFRQAFERDDKGGLTVCREQFKELLAGFDFALISTLASPVFVEPKQVFILNAAATEEVVSRLYSLAAKAEEDRSSLFKGNWRLVMEVARRFQAFGCKLDLDELIQEGNTGLLAAIDKFNPRMNLQLSTLAANWIQAKIRRALDNLSETIRTPVYKRQRRKMVQRAEMELLMESRRPQEGIKPLAAAKGPQASQQTMTGAEKLFGKTVEDKDIAARTGLDVEEVQELRRLYPETVSIHATMGGNDDSDKNERGDLIADKSHEDEDPIEDKADKKLFFDLLTRLVNDLPLVYQVVLSGLNGLPIRKASLKKLVRGRIKVLEQRGKSMGKGLAIMGKAQVQVFK